MRAEYSKRAKRLNFVRFLRGRADVGGRPWEKEAIASLGTQSERTLGEKTGRTTLAVTNKCWRLGIGISYRLE